MLRDFQRVYDTGTLVTSRLAKVCPLTDSSITPATCYYWQTFYGSLSKQICQAPL